MHLPEPKFLINILNKMGIGNDDQVILYPKKILIFTQWLRLHQFFSHLNFKNISILNGGYPDFKKKFDLFIEEGEFKVKANSDYKAQINRSILANSNDIIESKKIIIN